MPLFGRASGLVFVGRLMEDQLLEPKLALEPDEYQRFLYACAHERRSPSTHRGVDAAAAGWIYDFVHSRDDNRSELPEDWLEPLGPNPRMIGSYFGRVAIRLRRTDAFEYASALENHFHEIADTRGLP